MIRCDSRFGSERPGQRASHRAVYEALGTMAIEVNLTQLDAGDFAFLGNGPDGPMNIGIELKVINDLISSMRSGRLAEQVLGMSEQYGRSYLIVEGFYRAKRGSGLLEVPRGRRWAPLVVGPRPVFWGDVEKFITGLEEAGVRVRRTRTAHETARVIALLQEFWNKDYDDHRSLQVLKTPAAPLALVREDERITRVRRVAASLGVGIGWGRSKAVAARFKSILGLALADAGEWEQIDGIGKTIAKEAHRVIREEILPVQPSAGRVPARRGTRTRSARNSRRGEDPRVDTGRRAQRGVSAARTGRRVPLRGGTE